MVNLEIIIILYTLNQTFRHEILLSNFQYSYINKQECKSWIYQVQKVFENLIVCNIYFLREIKLVQRDDDNRFTIILKILVYLPFSIVEKGSTYCECARYRNLTSVFPHTYIIIKSKSVLATAILNRKQNIMDVVIVAAVRTPVGQNDI